MRRRGIRAVTSGAVALVLVGAGAIGIASPAWAASPLSNPVTSDVAQIPSSVATTVGNPCNSGGLGVACGSATTMNFGTGVGKRLDSFTAAGNTFQVLPVENGVAYTEVFRVDNPQVTGERDSIFIARNAGDAFNRVVGSDPGSRRMEDVFSSDIITEGSDNTFANQGTTNINDVERISFLRRTPITTGSPTRVGLTLLERGGNDAVKVAPVLGVDGSGEPDLWGPLVSIPTGSWGTVLANTPSTVLRRDPTDAAYRPTDITGAQTLSGMYISFADLGVAAGTPVYGVSIVGNDETGPNPTAFRLITAGGGQGGIDLIGGVFVSAVPPTAQDDASAGTQGASQALRIRAAAGDSLFTVDPAKTVLLAPSGGTVDAAGTVVALPGVGTYTLNRSTNLVTFQPVPSFTGAAPVVTYQVTDSQGATATATLSPTVTPVAAPDTSTGPRDSAQTTDVLANDTGSGVGLDRATLTLVGSDGAAAQRVTVPEGVYAIDSGHRVTFTPSPGFVGTATPVAYRVDDTAGNTVESTYTPAVTAAAVADTSTGPQGRAQDMDVLRNDLPSPSDLFLASTLELVGPGGTGANAVTVAGEGTYTVIDGRVVFQPEPGFTGTATPVSYRVSDSTGDTVTATITPTVTPVSPLASPDVSSGVRGAVQSVDPLGNDAGGDPAVPIAPSSLTLLGGSGTAVPSVTVPGQGVYDIVGGRIRFTPEVTFVGTVTPVRYRIADENGTTATSTYTPTVTAEPVAVVADSAQSTVIGRTVVFDLGPSVPGLVPSSVRLVSPSGAGVITLDVPGQGTWSVDPTTGRIAFTPAAGFGGRPTPVMYRAVTAAGAPVSGTLSVTYRMLAATGPDASGPVGFAGLLLLGGTALVAGARIRRRA